jgi:hypothetical protein
MNTQETIDTLATAAASGDTAAAMAFTDAVKESGGEAGFKSYYPEMGEAKPAAQMEARLSHGGNHYFVDTPLTLSGRGIEYRGKFSGVPGSRKTGWNQYKVTCKAMEKLERQYSVSSESLL